MISLTPPLSDPGRIFPFEPLIRYVVGGVFTQDFVVSFFVELSVMMLERLYLDPGVKEVRKSVCNACATTGVAVSARTPSDRRASLTGKLPNAVGVPYVFNTIRG